MTTFRLKIALRNLWKHKRSSFINVAGLALGMACCFLVILYCWHEFNYDTFHPDGERLYRIEYNMDRAGAGVMNRIPPTIAPAVQGNYPEVEAITRFYPRELSVALPETNQQFEMEDVFFVDSTVTEVFAFDFLYGNPATALHHPDAVVLSDVTALKLFGRMDVVGESVQLAGEDGYRVSSVVKAWPNNGHLEFSMLLPFNTMIKVEPEHARENARQFITHNWTATHSYTYLKLKPNQSPERVNKRLKELIMEKGHEQIRDRQSFSLIPVSRIHLYSEAGGPKPSGNLSYLYIFLLIGALTLLIACINFINLSTASSMTRAKEVGVRKVLGASQRSLVGQFLTESLVLSFVAFVLALLLTWLALPHLNDLTGLEIPFALLQQPVILLLFVSIFVVAGLLAGLYPAFVVSRYQAVSILKGQLGVTRGRGNEWLRKGLISVQFLAAIVFISGATTLYLQLQYLRSQPMGFKQDLVLALPLNSGNNINALVRPGDATLRGRMNTFDKSLLDNPGIKAVTQCSSLPGTGAIGRHVTSAHTPEGEQLVARTLAVDYDFVELFDLELLAGRDFDVSFGVDHLSSFMVNEKAMKLLGWEDPVTTVGKEMNMEGKKGNIVGVLKDFNFQSLHEEIQPLVMEVRPGIFGYFAVQIENTNISQTLAFLQDQWTQHFPEKVFEYQFLDETLQEAYQAESRLSAIISYFAFLAIFIACFGLFGLAALLIQQRFKEIGIRKVLGASVLQILHLIARDFMILIGIAVLLALPITWYFLNNWLLDFAYRIAFPWWATVASGVVVLVVALLTVGWQTARAGMGNPVEVLRED